VFVMSVDETTFVAHLIFEVASESTSFFLIGCAVAAS